MSDLETAKSIWNISLEINKKQRELIQLMEPFLPRTYNEEYNKLIHEINDLQRKNIEKTEQIAETFIVHQSTVSEEGIKFGRKNDVTLRRILLHDIKNNLPLNSARPAGDRYYILDVNKNGIVLGSDCAAGISGNVDDLLTSDLFQLWSFIENK